MRLTRFISFAMARWSSPILMHRVEDNVRIAENAPFFSLRKHLKFQGNTGKGLSNRQTLDECCYDEAP